MDEALKKETQESFSLLLLSAGSIAAIVGHAVLFLGLVG